MKKISTFIVAAAVAGCAFASPLTSMKVDNLQPAEKKVLTASSIKDVKLTDTAFESVKKAKAVVKAPASVDGLYIMTDLWIDQQYPDGTGEMWPVILESTSATEYTMNGFLGMGASEEENQVWPFTNMTDLNLTYDAATGKMSTEAYPKVGEYEYQGLPLDVHLYCCALEEREDGMYIVPSKDLALELEADGTHIEVTTPGVYVVGETTDGRMLNFGVAQLMSMDLVNGVMAYAEFDENTEDYVNRSCFIYSEVANNGNVIVKNIGNLGFENGVEFVVDNVNKTVAADNQLVLVYQGINLYMLPFSTQTGEPTGETVVNGTIGSNDYGSTLNLDPWGIATAPVNGQMLTYENINTEISLFYDLDEVNSAIDNIVADDANAPVEYFNLQGVKVQNPENGLYIKRQGKTVEKVFIRK